MNRSKSNDPRFWSRWRASGAVGTIERYPMAVVREINGQLVLDDPQAVAIIGAISKANCRRTLDMNMDRVAHFKRRAIERNMVSAEVVIVILNVDDVHGGMLAEVLMPGTNWQEFRDRGQTPFARGLATREGIQEILETFDREAAAKLRTMADLAVVVVDFGVAEVFAVPQDAVSLEDFHIQPSDIDASVHL
jgi:hypothetical protein